MTLASTRPGLLFILVAPAGAGKNALMSRVMERVGKLRQLPTATTRAMRDTEAQGREHLFVTVEEFQQMLADNLLLEHQIVHGNYYGIPRATVEQALDAGEDLIADIEYLGADYTRSQYPENVILIFIQPPSVKTLIERMRSRGDNEADICRRLLRVPQELAFAAQCDYLIVNEDIDEAAETLYGIVLAARSQREVTRLKAQTDSGAQLFASVSAAVVVHEDQVVWGHTPPYLPVVTPAQDEQPHIAALRAANEQLGLTLDEDDLVHLTPPKPNLVPPAGIDFMESDGDQPVVMMYVCRAESRFDLPEGWTWQPHTDMPLPPMIHEVLAASPT